ncbi:hypothetical protein [Pseudovibrio sp. POLY-S9]|uniref:hypothetical protein n=1 Tax=Pseudovibrio sp. POLY-S9 TaxID=1576596 RepID=UPI0009E6601F|nr:hypothetical protein [Pseudovibrio sp. POLY-S9]
MTSSYTPPRQTSPRQPMNPMEIELVFNVRPCGTCSFFWPPNPKDQVYGPYPTYDFLSDFPKIADPSGTPEMYPWVKGITRNSGFPNGEIMDGCRKAPIMTLGINPNLTAFSPGITGTSWAYPDFTSDDGTDGYDKYAYYYRYRNVYQERFAFEEVKKYLIAGSSVTPTADTTVTADQIIAAEDGIIKSAERDHAGSPYDVIIEYESGAEITLTLERPTGTPRYVLLFNHDSPDNKFEKGDIVISKMQMPAGVNLEVYQELQTYYEQFVPSLNEFSDYLRAKGHKSADLKIGEDVCQLDMVACASPHWKPAFLGGTEESEDAIISNCVTKNAWALKQLVMTNPAVLFLVGESSWDMFRDAFKDHIKRSTELPTDPYDNAFTLFSLTTENDNPTMFEFYTEIDGKPYTINTRIVVTPHFSYDTNFLPQFRLSSDWFAELKEKSPECVHYLETNPEITYVPGNGDGYDAFQFSAENAPQILKTIKSQWPEVWPDLEKSFYDAHATMADVLRYMYREGKLTWDDKGDYLSRSAGPCQFCVNEHWKFPLGCPYGKPEEKPLPIGFLNQVTDQILSEGA